MMMGKVDFLLVLLLLSVSRCWGDATPASCGSDVWKSIRGGQEASHPIHVVCVRSLRSSAGPQNVQMHLWKVFLLLC